MGYRLYRLGQYHQYRRLVQLAGRMDDAKQPSGDRGGLFDTNASDEKLKLDVEYAYSWYNNFTRDIFY
jgi:hypothetical protein